MTDNSKSPSRGAGYAGLVRDLVARDGLNCMLCGHKHASVHTAQADSLDPESPFDLPNLILACKPCAKRRNGKPIGAYWRERLVAASTEIAHIQMMAGNKKVLEALTALCAAHNGRDVPLCDVTGAEVEVVEEVAAEPVGQPWENLKRRVRLYNSNTILPEERRVSGWPKDAQHGDMYVDHNTGAASIYCSVDDMWIADDVAQDTGVVPEKWPPRDIETWNR